MLYKKRIRKHLRFKDKVRTDFLPLIVKVLHFIGFSWQKLGRTKLSNSVLIAQGASIAKTLKPERNEKPLNIYFLTMLGGHTHNVSVDIILAWGLKKKGHNIYFILDDQVLPITEITQAGQETMWDEISARSYNFGYKYIKACGFNVLNVSKIVNINQPRDISEFETIIEAGILKHYKVGIITDDLPLLEDKRRKLQESTKISALIGDYLVRQKPDRVIMSHGIYPTWGPAFEILNRSEIPVVTYSKTKKRKTEKFNWNYTADWWDVSYEWEKVKDQPLSQEQQKRIDHYLKSRIMHSEDVLVYNFVELEECELTRKRFNLASNKLTYSLFTNVLWDASSAQREIAFKNPIEWVLETIEWFRGHPEKQLIVKIHPAEKVIGTNQQFADIILKRINLPDNVRLIRPDEKVNSWSIYKVTDLGIVHTTTAGMEMPLVMVPCVVVSRTHYRGKGFTIDVNSKSEYFKCLEDFKPEQIDRNKLKILAERYAFLLFERYQVPFDVFDEVKWTDVRSFTFNDIKGLFNVNFFEEIINAIINRKEFLTKG